MKNLFLLLFLITLLWFSSVPLIIRGYARMNADEIICGNRYGTEGRINSCISVLAWFTKWHILNTKEDRHRIDVLRDMLDEVQKRYSNESCNLKG